MKRKVCFLMPMYHSLKNYRDFVRGWEIIIHDYSIRLAKVKYQPVWMLIMKGDLEVDQPFNGIPIIKIRNKFPLGNPLNFLGFTFKIMLAIWRNHIDIMYTRVSLFGLAAGTACKITKVPFIFHAEDLEADLIKHSKFSIQSYFSAMFMLFVQKIVAMMANRVITVSKSFKDFLVDNWHIRESKIHVLYEGVERSNIPKTLPPYGKYCNFLYLGGTNTYDGIDVLLKAFAKVVRRSEKVKLIIATYSPKQSITCFRNLCDTLGIKDHVKFFVSISGKTARDLVRNSDVGVVVRKRTLSTELTTSSVIFLFLSEGLPIVAPRLKAISEILSEDDALFEPGNPNSLAKTLTKIAENYKFREKLRKVSLGLRDDFDREKMCNRFVQIIDNLLRAP